MNEGTTFTPNFAVSNVANETRETKPANASEVISAQQRGYYELDFGLLRITGSHPIYTKKPDGTEGWAVIQPTEENPLGFMKFEAEDLVLTADNTWLPIRQIRYIETDINVYNITVAQKHHTFFAEGILVHNGDPGSKC